MPSLPLRELTSNRGKNHRKYIPIRIGLGPAIFFSVTINFSLSRPSLFYAFYEDPCFYKLKTTLHENFFFYKCEKICAILLKRKSFV